MKQWGRWIYSIIFLGTLLFGAWHLSHPKEEILKYENRKPVDMPPTSFVSFFAQGASPEVELALKDRLFRDDLVLWEAYLDRYFYRRPFINHIHVKPPHFYDFSDHEKYVGAEDKTEETIAKFIAIKKELEKEGTEFIVVPVPMISSVWEYPKGILNPETIDQPAQERLIHGLQEAGIHIINPRELLTKEDFFSTDHHIKVSGAEKIISQLETILAEQNLSLVHSPIRFRTHRFKGSRSKMMAYLTEDEPIEEPIYQRKMKRSIDGLSTINDFETMTSYVSYMGGDHRETLIEAEDGEGPYMVIYGDSFTNVFEALLAPRLGRLRSYDIRFGRVKAPERKADVVVLIAAENAFRLGEEYLEYFENISH
ncbi:MAG: hypothetical protein Q4Q17_00785 [Tissierellia bacterium]|nr:hypothetical protein [Tissierellia bacterium]